MEGRHWQASSHMAGREASEKSKEVRDAGEPQSIRESMPREETGRPIGEASELLGKAGRPTEPHGCSQ